MSFKNDVVDHDQNARILIVDDNKDIHDDFKLILESAHKEQSDELDELDELLEHVLDEKAVRNSNDCNFQLDSAFQGKEALQLVEEAYSCGRPYTVVFMDVRMPPGWNGIETIRQIWKKFPDIEMVICTAYSDFSWEEINQTLGGSHRLLMLKKPFDRTYELRAAQNKLVEFIRSETGEHFHIEVAAYPEYHPQASNAKSDFQHFVNKMNAGANSAITQYFFNPDAYLYFVERCQKAGIDKPIIPGIMPITNYSRLLGFSDMCGAEIPRWIRKRLEDYQDDMDSLKSFGIDVISKLCQQLLEADAPGLHFYSLNQSDTCIKICNNLSD